MAPQGPAKPATQKQAGPAPIAFRTGVQSHDEINFDETRTMQTSTVDLPTLNIPPAGFLRGLFLLMECTTAGNSANVAYQQDGPFSAIDTITLEDVNSAPILGPLGGWDLYVINKLGGYDHSSDPKQSPTYTAVTSTGATGGSFSFVLRVPVELVDRDALGPLPNKSGTSMFKVRIRMAPSTAVYSTAPTTLGSVRTRIVQVSWWDPDATDLRGRPIAQVPPAMGTTQYWSKVPYVVAAGAFRQPMERVGYAIRNLILVLRDSANSRSQGETDFPDPLALQVDANVLNNKVGKVWQHEIAVDYGYTGTAEAANGPVNGTRVLTFCKDFGLKPGAESRRGYLETSSATRLEFYGTIGGSGQHTLTVLTNDVAPMGSYDQITA